MTPCIVYTPCHDVSGRYINQLLNVSQVLTEIPDQSLSYSTKYCDEYGKWNATVSDACNSEFPMETSTFITMVQANTTIVFCMHVLSVVLTSGALLAFQFLPGLNCARNKIHKNLILSFLLYHLYCLIIIPKLLNQHKNYERYQLENFGYEDTWLNTTIYPNDLCHIGSYFEQIPLCRILKPLFFYIQLANYTWMFCEGYFLHSQVVVHVFSGAIDLAPFYLFGWIAPVALTIPLCMMIWHTTATEIFQLEQLLVLGYITKREFYDASMLHHCWDESTKAELLFITLPNIGYFDLFFF